MRLQYAVVCQEFQDGEWDGATNLYGVRHKLFVSSYPTSSGTLQDPPVAQAQVPVKLVISLIDGEPGSHNVWVSVRQPGGDVWKKIPPLAIEWDEASPTFFVIFDIGFELFEEGTYEFMILVDGQPLGTVPLPVEIIPMPG